MNTPDLSSEFPLAAELCYLNHAAVAPWPRRTSTAVARFAQENCERGATDYEHWIDQQQTLRRQLQRLINAPSIRNIALQKNTSEGLSAIAYGLDWQPGDRVLITDQEFPSNRIVWESLGRLGVAVVEAELSAHPTPEQAIIDRLENGVKLLSVSAVQYGTGLTLDLAQLGAACRQRGILFCVDAIQSLGALPFDVQACNADFVVADGHKWMLGPEGLAVLYVADAHLESLHLHQFGWHMVKDRGQYDQRHWEPAPDARRFECGSPNMLGVVALSASLSLLEQVGIGNVHAALQQRIAYLEQRLLERDDLVLITDTRRPLRSGILTFRHVRLSATHLFHPLRQQQVVCAPRGGGIRFSPHFYTPFDVLDRAVHRIPRE